METLLHAPTPLAALAPPPYTPPERPPTRLSITELVELDVPDVPFVVSGLLPVGLSLLGAKPKIGKSWFALGLAMRVAAGASFLGYPTETGDVLFMALEDRHLRLQSRIAKVHQSGDPLPDQVEFWLEAPPIGQALLADLDDWAQRSPNPRLVIIDTMGRLMPPRSTKNDEYTFYTQTLGGLQQYAFEQDLAILLIHHTKKSNGDSEDPFDEILGSTAISGVMDAALILHRHRIEGRGELIVTGRDIEESRTELMIDGASGLWLPYSPNPLTKLADIASDQFAVLQAVAQGHSAPQNIADELGKLRTNVQNLLSKLKDKGLVEKPARGHWAITERAKEHIESVRDPDTDGDIGDIGDIHDAPSHELDTAEVESGAGDGQEP